MQDAEHTRHLVLQRCNAWIAQNWAPSWDYPTAWDEAILKTVGGPVRREGLLLQEVRREHFTDEQLQLLRETYFELMKLAADYDRLDGTDALEQRIARYAFETLHAVLDRPSESRESFSVDIGSGRRNAASRWVKRHDSQDSLSEMYEVVVLWLINTPGGLWETTDSLIGLAGLDDDGDD